MKKSILAAALAAVMLLSGCSGVSEESYNSVVAENTNLQSEKSALESEKSKIASENTELKAKIAELEKQNSELRDELNSQGDNTSSSNETFAYSEFTSTAKAFKIEETGNKWWHDDMNTFVSYIEENEYLHKSDDELVVNAYYDMLKCVVDYPSSLVQFYVFAISKKDGSCVAIGFLSVTGEGDNKKLSTALEWSGEFSRLNTNPQQIEIFGQPD